MAKKKQENGDILDDVVKGIRGTGLYDISRKVLLAAAGTAGLASDEMKTFVDKLVERGELAEQDARRLMVEAIEKRDQAVRERRSEKSKQEKSTATKADIEELSTRIMELNKMIETLKTQQETAEESEQEE